MSRGIPIHAGVTAENKLTGLFVSNSALSASLGPKALARLRPNVAWQKAELDTVTSAQRLPAALSALFAIDSARAQTVVNDIVASGQPGSVFRKEGSSFIDIAPSGRAGMNDARRGWEDVVTVDTRLRPGLRELTRFRHAPLAIAAAGAALLGGIGVLAFRRYHGDKASQVAKPFQLDPNTTLASIAETAKAQVTGETDHTSDNQLNPTVAAYMRATEGITPSLTRDWTVDFTAWVCRSAGVPIGTNGAGGVDMNDLLDWAGEPGRMTPIASAKIVPGQLLVSGDPAGKLSSLDIGVVVKVDGDQLQVVYGNRWVSDGADGNAVGAVRTVITSRHAKGLIGVIDPTAKDSQDTPAQAQPETPATPAKPAAPSAKPAPHSGDHAITGATIRRRGTPPPVASATAPTRAQLENFFDWAASQYATDDAQARELSTLSKNIAAVETHFGVNSLNLWDSNAVAHMPSFGMFQFIKPTYDGFSARAKDDNPQAWSDLGSSEWSDWRSQALTASWALAQPPSAFSRANNGWAGEHGRYWSRWASVYNMVNGRGSVPQGDPRTSHYWSNQLDRSSVDHARNQPVEQRTVWPNQWYASGKRLSAEQLHEIVRTGQVYGIPQ